MMKMIEWTRKNDALRELRVINDTEELIDIIGWMISRKDEIMVLTVPNGTQVLIDGDRIWGMRKDGDEDKIRQAMRMINTEGN